ncbi:MAG: hypothetical protein QM664_11255 [Flavihumibacter sp.]
MEDVTVRVLDELNTIPGTPLRPGLSRIEMVRPAINAYVERYVSDALDTVLSLPTEGLWPYWETVDKRLLDFEFDTQEKDTMMTYIEDEATSEQQLITTTAMPQPDFETIVLERAGDVFPKLISVSIPASLDLSNYAESGLPFHIYFHPTLGQNLASYYTAVNEPKRESLKDTIDHQYAPYGWDFLYFILLRNLQYEGSTNLLESGQLNEWAGKGLLYQTANTSRDIITVIPVLDPSRNAGDFEKPGTLLPILEEVQELLFARNNTAPASSAVGRTAVSAFSSGHSCLNNLLQAYANDGYAAFYGDTLQEVYMFDAPQQLNATSVTLANGWAKKYGSDKVIRAYSQWVPANVGLLLAAGQHSIAGKAVVNADNSNRSFAHLNSVFFKDVLRATDWQSIHQAIPALMLTDALSRSGF